MRRGGTDPLRPGSLAAIGQPDVLQVMPLLPIAYDASSSLAALANVDVGIDAASAGGALVPLGEAGGDASRHSASQVENGKAFGDAALVHIEGVDVLEKEDTPPG